MGYLNSHPKRPKMEPTFAPWGYEDTMKSCRNVSASAAAKTVYKVVTPVTDKDREEAWAL